MILPPRTQNQTQPPSQRRIVDLERLMRHASLPPANLPDLKAFASPPWNRLSPERLRIEDDLDANHLARFIDEAVDQLDLSALFASFAGVGSKAHRPDLMLKVLLYEIQTGHLSPAQWARDAKDRRCLQWLGMGITPSRNCWYVFRERVGTLLEDFLRQVLTAAVARGFTTARRGSLDGTAVEANASRHCLVNLSRLQRRLAELDRVIAADKDGQDPGTILSWMARTPGGRRRQRYRFGVAQRQLVKHHARNARRSSDKRQKPEKIVVSLGDSEAALGRDKHKVFRPLYTVEVVQDLESPLILGYEVFAQAADAGTLLPMRQCVQNLTGVWIERLLVDSGYASALDLLDCKRVGVDLYAPYQENDLTEQKRAQTPDRQIPKSQFVWLPEEQTYACPKGHRLTPQGQEARARADGRSVEVTTYRCPKQHCQNCPLASRCTRGKNGRTIKRSEHEELIEAHQAKMGTPEGKAIYRQRSQTIELRFADLKTHRKLRRFSGRGLKRVRIEVGPLVLSHNLLVVRAAEHRKAVEGPNATSCQDAA
jgi:transposase